MGISLEDVLAILNLDANRVKAGKDALGNKVDRVNVLEAPDAIKWLAGNEFLLTTGYALQDNDESRKQFIQKLADKGIAGLGIKAGRYLDPIPQEMIEEGDRLGFPIIELPAHLPLSQVITPVYEHLLNQQVCRLKQSQAIHTKFLDVVLRGEGFESISSTLSDLIKRPCLIIDADRRIVAHSGLEAIRPLESEALKELFEKTISKCDGFTLLKTYQLFSFADREEGTIENVAFFPVNGGNHFWGGIIVWAINSHADLQWVTACEHAATVAALEFAKQDSIFRANLTSESQLLVDILEGNFSSLQSVERRLEYFGFKLGERLRTIVLDIIDFESYYMQETEKSEKYFQGVIEEIYRLTKGLFHAYSGSFLGGIKSDSVIAFVSIKDDEAENAFKRIIFMLSETLKREFPRIRISCGISRTFGDLGEVRRSFDEALIACKVGRNLSKDSLVAYYEDLGPYACLNEIKELPMARQLYDDTIGLLEKYDEAQGTELVYTLQSYFLSNDNVRQTAKKLFMHRNSLEYRLKRIEELTGKKLNNFHDRFELMFSLALRKLLKIER